jgi:hypothetical protein
MRSVLCTLLIALAMPALGYDFGDRRLAPLEDPVRVEYPAGAGPSAEKLREVVAAVAPTHEWRVASPSGGRIELERSVRGRHLLRVALDEDARGYSLRYLESVNLMYRDFERQGEKLRLIHSNYNAWVQELASAIAGALGIKARPLAGFAALESVDALPYVRASGREAYAKFLKSATPRAFAIAPNGAFGSAAPREGGGRHRQREFGAIERALERCNQRADGQCHLYAIDERVVWRGQ